jgi:ABC-type antimicrobial peptide transport system permease subunit
MVNGQPMTIVGVAPRGFDGTTVGSKPQVFVPITTMGLISPNYDGFENRLHYDLYLFARLKPGVSIEQASAGINIPYRAIIHDVEVPLQEMTGETMEWFKAAQLQLQPGNRGQSILHTEASAPLNVLFGVTIFVLLIACANVANLLLARGASRTDEMAVRLSLGAGRRHLILQLLAESCLLAVMGGVVGLIVALWTQDLLASLVPADVAALDFRIDTTLLLFTGSLTLGTGLLFGLFPALHSTRPDLVSTLKANAGQPGGGRAAKRFRSVIATAQIALSMALLVLAGLFTKS